MNKRYILIYKPVILIIELPHGKGKITEQNFQAGDGEICFTYFEVIDNGIPEDIYDIVHENHPNILSWEFFKQESSTLSLVISEGLLTIGVRLK